MTIPARITVTAPIATIETLSQGGGVPSDPDPDLKGTYKQQCKCENSDQRRRRLEDPATR